MAAGPGREITEDLIAAFVRLAQGDFTVRLPRKLNRDTEDVLAMFVNLIAEELERLLSDRDRTHRRLEEAVAELSEDFLALAAGDFGVRAKRSETGDPVDVLAFLFNNTAEEMGETFGEVDRQRLVLEAILESMIDGVLLLDPTGVIQRANGAFAQLLGGDAAELAGRPLSTVLAAGPAERELTGNLAALLEQGPLRDRDTRFRTVAGETVVISVNASAHRDVDGKLASIVLVARDDRQLKRARAQLQMSDRLATMGTVAAGVAHEINNPLSYVMANLEFIGEELSVLKKGEPLSAERVDEALRALTAAQGGAERVRKIVKDLKALSRVEEDAVTRVDLNRLVDSALNMIRKDIRHHARLAKELGPVPPIEANEGRLVQVFLNLMQNAAQAIPEGNVEGNEIRIVTGTDPGGAAFVEIHDTGCGIPEENLARIFDAFYTTKPVGIGTGLGLSICHKLVASAKGNLTVKSQVGVGTVFRVTLPAAL